MFQTKRRIWVRVLFGLLALALIVGAGMFAFRIGMTRGVMLAGEGTIRQYEFGSMPGVWNHHYPSHFSFFPFGSLLFGFLFLMLIFGLLRRAFWGPRWGMYGHGGKFSRLEEMHAEMHKRMDAEQNKPADAPEEESDAKDADAKNA